MSDISQWQNAEHYVQALEFDFLLTRVEIVLRSFCVKLGIAPAQAFSLQLDDYGDSVVQVGILDGCLLVDEIFVDLQRHLDQLRGTWSVEFYDWRDDSVQDNPPVAKVIFSTGPVLDVLWQAK